MSNHQRSRRFVLRSLIGASAAICLPRLSPAQTGKTSKAQAEYQDQPNGDQKCSNCVNFIAPSSCRVVDGNVSANGWCKLWVAK